MKKILFNILLAPALLAVSLSSCNDWLELKPTTEIVEEDMWKNQMHVEGVVASCYNALLSNDVMTRIIVYGELRSDNLTYSNAYDEKLGQAGMEQYKSVSLSSILPIDGLTSWASIYTVINYCNFVIHYAPGVCDIDPDYQSSEMRANVAEARALRALCYFYLIRAFDRVPYITEPTVDDTKDQFIPQSDQSVVLTGIIEDLKYAAVNAMTAYPQPSETKYRITRKAALAILADVYLWQASGLSYPQDSITYDKVIECCDQVYNTNIQASSNVGGNARYTNYAPWDGRGSYASIFESSISAPSSEVIFALYADRNTAGEQKGDDSNTLIAINKLYGPVSPASGVRGDLSTTYLVAPNDKYPIAPAQNLNFVAVETPFAVETNTTSGQEDARFYYAGWTVGSAYTVQKYKYNSIGLQSYPAWIFYRVSDIYLMKAEALVEKMRCNAQLNSEGIVFYPNDSIQIRNALAGTPTTFYTDTLKKAFQLCKFIFDRANNKATIRTSYAKYGDGTYLKQIDELVYAERRREFIFEGKRWFDLMRIARRDAKYMSEDKVTQKIITAVKTKLEDGADLIGSRLASMDALYWPVNKYELETNYKLVQNEYYLSTAVGDDYEK